MILGSDSVSVPVEDFEVAERFCRHLLGLRAIFERPNRWAEYDLGAVRFAVYPREADEGRGGESPSAWMTWTGRSSA